MLVTAWPTCPGTVNLPGDVIDKESSCCPSVIASCYRSEETNLSVTYRIRKPLLLN